MKETVSIQEKSLQEKLGELLRTSRLVILIEIVVVLLPMYLGLIINDRSGTDHIPLGRNVVVLGGPDMYLGMIISLLLLWITSRLRGAGLGLLDILVPFAWWRSLAMASAVISLLLLIIFWNFYLIIGVLIDVLILITLIFTNWTPE